VALVVLVPRTMIAMVVGRATAPSHHTQPETAP